MSTTIKRVALVAVAALTLGVVSVAPSTAAINSDSLTLSAATAAQTTAETATATSAVATLSFLGTAGDSASVTAALVSGPAGNTALPYLALTETASATINEINAAAGSVTAPNTAVRVSAGSSAAVTTAKFKVYLGVAGSPVTAPTVAGTYVVRLTPASVGASGALLGSAAQTLTITVTTAPTLDTTVSAATTTSILNVGETNTATADAVVTGSKVVPATNNAAIGTIAVSLKNAAGSAVSDSYTAQVISGPGLLGSGAAGDGTTFAAVGRAITVKATDVVGIFPDGASGVSKIEIRTAAGVLLATESVTFFGDIASIVATVAKPVVGTTAADAVTAKAYDAAGVLVSSGSLYFVSGTPTVIASNTAGAVISPTTGVATFSVTGLTAGTTTITVGNKSTASTVTAAAVSVRVGSSTPASVTVTTDKASYAPGEAAVISVVLLDANGLTVADGVYNNIFATGGIAGSYTIGSLTDTTTVTIASGVGARTVYLPVTEGDVKLSWTTGTNLATANQAVAGSVTVAVSSAATSAAIDAANEAAQAASDATDAALAAADAADAATTKAQEAVDAGKQVDHSSQGSDHNTYKPCYQDPEEGKGIIAFNL
jgi:hypothetical protein